MTPTDDEASRERPPVPVPPFVLASRSPRRQKLLRDAGYQFIVEPANVNESEFPARLTPPEVALHLARAKARCIAERFRDSVVLAADTLVVFAERLLGQPKDADDARITIQLLGGATHIVITAVAVQHATKSFAQDARIMSAVQMRQLTAGEINRYIATNLWQGKAGGYGVQDDAQLIDRVRGCRTNVIGLPMKTTARLLAAAGITPSRVT